METKYLQYKILFVDDDENILKSLEREMRQEKFQRIYSSSVDKARDILQHDDIAVMVSDLSMPGTNGVEFLKEVKDNHPSVIRTVLTAVSDTRTILDVIEKANIFRYLTKPWRSQSELLSSMYQSIDQYILQKEKDLRTQELLLQNKALVQLNRRLKDAQYAIVELERRNTALAMGITANHELNQPLMVLSANIEMLREMLAEKGLSDGEERIFENVKNAFIEIDDILKKYREATDVQYGSYLDNDMMLVFRDEDDKVNKR